jgi:hypothetical protein
MSVPRGSNRNPWKTLKRVIIHHTNTYEIDASLQCFFNTDSTTVPR